MPSYNALIGSGEAGALIPEEAVNEIVKATAQASAAAQLCTIRRMSSRTATQPVLQTAPVAFWVEDGLKQTSGADWGDVTMTAAEIAVIIPVKDDVLADADFDIWGELRDPIGQAFALRLDQAVFAGVGKPAAWPEAIIPLARAAGNVVGGGSPAGQGGVFNDLALAMDQVEAGGFEVTGFAAQRALKGRLRTQRTTTGELSGEIQTDRVWDVPVAYPVSTSLPSDALAVAGDWSTAILGVRQDMVFEMFNTGVISDDTGKIIRNLLQEDVTAMRITARYAYTTAVPVTLEGGECPFSVLEGRLPVNGDGGDGGTEPETASATAKSAAKKS